MKLVSQIDLYISSTSGHAIRMKAGEPINVRDELVPIALAKGAKAVGGEQDVVIDTTPAGDEAMLAVKEAIEALVTEGDPSKFDSKGRPKLTAIKEILGYPVTAAMRDTALED
jgi:hypothetical protein